MSTFDRTLPVGARALQGATDRRLGEEGRAPGLRERGGAPCGPAHQPRPSYICPAPLSPPTSPPPPFPRRIVGSGCRLRGGPRGSRHGAAAGKPLAPYPRAGGLRPLLDPALRSGPGAVAAGPARQGFTSAPDAGVPGPHARAGGPTQAAPGPRLAPGPESGLALPGHRSPGPSPARALGSSPARRSLPSLPAEPGPAGLPGRGAADTARRGSGRLPSAEVPPAAGHAPGPQREVPAATARQDGELWSRRGDGALLDRGWGAREPWPHQNCLVRRLSTVLQTVNHNTKRFRFALPTAHHVLGLPVGKKDGVGSFSWYPDRVAPLLGSPAPHSCLLVPSHSVLFSPPGCRPSRL